jgi:hypothetical protein
MTAWRGRNWLLALMSGYLLFYAILFAETAYILPRLYAHGYADFPAERFRAEWLRVALQLRPLHWFACGPCQRCRHLGLTLLPAAVLLLALGYLGALRAVQRQPEAWSFRRLLGLAAFAALPLALLLPPTSGDYVAYLFTGRLLSVYHVSPWHHVLAEFPAEQRYLSPTAWGASLQCIYGPVWAAVVAVTTGIAHLALPGDLTFAGLMLNVLLLRGAHALALAAAGAAVWRINGRWWPHQQRLVTAAFLLNPLLVYEAMGALHNDIWGVAFLLWTCDLFLRDDPRAARVPRFLVPLTLSFLTKYIILVMAPFIGVFYWRRRDWRRLGWLGATVFIGLGVVRLTSMHQMNGYVSASRAQFLLTPTCLPQFIAILLTLARGMPVLHVSLVQTAAQVAMVIYVPVYLALVARTRTQEQVITHSLQALLLYLACVYMQTVPWYYLWPLGLLCAIRWRPAVINAAWASSLMLLGYGVQLWNHAGLHGWDSWTLVPGFLMAVAVPALVCLAGHCGGWSVCAMPTRQRVPGVETGSADEPAPHPPAAGSRAGRKRQRRSMPEWAEGQRSTSDPVR